MDARPVAENAAGAARLPFQDVCPPGRQVFLKK
jgi:hypothetical protein